MNLQMPRTTRSSLVVAISSCFFLTEISVGFYTRSLALIADAFHYLNDIIGFIVALVAVRVSSKKDSPKDLSFGWQRAQLLGAFFNGIFLLALGVSIFLQSIGRFVSVEKVDHPMLVMIIGCIGFVLNVVSVTFLHAFELPSRRISAAEAYDAHPGHRHGTRDTRKKGYDLGLLAVFIHILGDAANNIGIVIAGAKSLASVHVAVADCVVSDFMKLASTINECFHGYGIHSATIQPELSVSESRRSSVQETLGGDFSSQLSCRIKCGSACEVLTCCGRTTAVDA
ncbi:zinc cadmium resistance protein [Aspergillus sp. HF37]|nr:zinc cadmium resistance protein [Aspergillus sp. HF37]